MRNPYKTIIHDVCPECGQYITASFGGSSIWDFHGEIDLHECVEGS